MGPCIGRIGGRPPEQQCERNIKENNSEEKTDGKDYDKGFGRGPGIAHEALNFGLLCFCDQIMAWEQAWYSEDEAALDELEHGFPLCLAP